MPTLAQYIAALLVSVPSVQAAVMQAECERSESREEILQAVRACLT